MNWKLIGALSLFGLAMGIGTVAVIPPNVERMMWPLIFLVCAFFIGRIHRRPFVHGLLLGLANSVWITAAHILFAGTYIANHAQEAAMMASMPMPDSPRLMMAVVGPVAGLISGIVIGILAVVAERVTRHKTATAA